MAAAVAFSLLVHAALLLFLTVPTPRAPEPVAQMTVMLRPWPDKRPDQPPDRPSEPQDIPMDLPLENVAESSLETGTMSVETETAVAGDAARAAAASPLAEATDASTLRTRVLDGIRGIQPQHSRDGTSPGLGTPVPALPSGATHFSPLMPVRGSGESLVWREAGGETVRSRSVLADGTIVCGRAEQPGLFQRFHAAVFLHTVCGRERADGPDPENPWIRPLQPD